MLTDVMFFADVCQVFLLQTIDILKFQFQLQGNQCKFTFSRIPYSKDSEAFSSSFFDRMTTFFLEVEIV